MVRQLMTDARNKYGPMKAAQQPMNLSSIIVPQPGAPKQD